MRIILKIFACIAIVIVAPLYGACSESPKFTSVRRTRSRPLWERSVSSRSERNRGLGQCLNKHFHSFCPKGEMSEKRRLVQVCIACGKQEAGNTSKTSLGKVTRMLYNRIIDTHVTF
jgi:hypothetical protein